MWTIRVKSSRIKDTNLYAFGGFMSLLDKIRKEIKKESEKNQKLNTDNIEIVIENNNNLFEDEENAILIGGLELFKNKNADTLEEGIQVFASIFRGLTYVETKYEDGKTKIIFKDIEFKNYTLDLIIGEDIPEDVPKEFHTINLYVRDEDDDLNLYAEVELPYTFNYAEFLNVENDPRYYFKEGYNPKYKTCKYTCELKPLGEKKGAYRILNGNYIKVADIDNLFEVKDLPKVKTLK